MGSERCEETMKVVEEVISKDIIKPSSPTPPYLRKYKLSFLDQIQPPIFMPMLFFYPKEGDSSSNNHRIEILKKSLSEVLTKYYPLSGRVFDNLYVDCSDQGVPYIEARANCNLYDVVHDPVPCELNKLLPFKLDEVEDLAMGIQVTFFNCGGIALGVCISHKVADALSFFKFVSNWATTAARGGLDEETVCPKFKMAELFPPIAISGPTYGIVPDMSSISLKRFVFSSSAINTLKNKYANCSNADFSPRPTRVEALSAFIWSRFVATTQPKPTEKNYSVLQAVNLRSRFDPPLPDNYFGNISRIAISAPKVDSERSDDCYGLVGQMRESLRQINSDYVAKLKEGHKHLDFINEWSQQISRGEVVPLSFTSLCRFPLYEADFGFGKPIWVSSAKLPFKNFCAFTDTASGDGIEAWISLKGEDMEKFEVDNKLLAFASPSPNAEELL